MAYKDQIKKREYHREYMRQYRLIPSKKKYYEDYYQKNKEVIKKRAMEGFRQKLYGLSDEQFEEMKSKQNNLCFICKKSSRHGRALSVDHDHDTGKIRVLLCYGCNFLMGRIEALGWDKIKPYIETYLIK